MTECKICLWEQGCKTCPLHEIKKESGRYEAELTKVSALLQSVLFVGKVKHIGLLEVGAGVKQLQSKLTDAQETIKTKDIIIRQLNKRLDDIGAQC